MLFQGRHADPRFLPTLTVMYPLTFWLQDQHMLRSCHGLSRPTSAQAGHTDRRSLRRTESPFHVGGYRLTCQPISSRNTQDGDYYLGEGRWVPVYWPALCLWMYACEYLTTHLDPSTYRSSIGPLAALRYVIPGNAKNGCTVYQARRNVFASGGYKFVQTLYNLVVKVVCLKFWHKPHLWLGGYRGTSPKLGVQCTPLSP